MEIKGESNYCKSILIVQIHPDINITPIVRA